MGNWHGRVKCEAGEFLYAAQLKSESNQGDGDDSAANSLNMKCTDDKVLTGDGSRFGTWSSWVSCPKNAAICGIKARIQRSETNGDNTGLNEVYFYCCGTDTSHHMLKVLFWFY